MMLENVHIIDVFLPHCADVIAKAINTRFCVLAQVYYAFSHAFTAIRLI